jgi:hypothetical protein
MSAVTKILALAFLASLALAAPASASGSAAPPATGKTLSAALLGKTLQP